MLINWHVATSNQAFNRTRSPDCTLMEFVLSKNCAKKSHAKCLYRLAHTQMKANSIVACKPQCESKHENIKQTSDILECQLIENEEHSSVKIGFFSVEHYVSTPNTEKSKSRNKWLRARVEWILTISSFLFRCNARNLNLNFSYALSASSSFDLLRHRRRGKRAEINLQHKSKQQLRLDVIVHRSGFLLSFYLCIFSSQVNVFWNWWCSTANNVTASWGLYGHLWALIIRLFTAQHVFFVFKRSRLAFSENGLGYSSLTCRMTHIQICSGCGLKVKLSSYSTDEEKLKFSKCFRARFDDRCVRVACHNIWSQTLSSFYVLFGWRKSLLISLILCKSNRDLSTESNPTSSTSTTNNI